MDPPRRLTGWWPGDGDQDDIAGSQDAVLHGDATFGPGAVGGSFVLDGDGDFVDVPDDPALDVGAGDFTVDLWVNFKDTTGEQVLAEKWVQRFGELSSGWTLTKLEDNSIGFFTEGPGIGGLGISSVPLSIQVNTWIHFAARKAGDTVDIFMNGSVIASHTNPGTEVDLNSASSLKFGHRGGESDTPGAQGEQLFYLNGRVDEAELTVGDALTDQELLSIYLAGAAGKCKDNLKKGSCGDPPDGLTNWWPGDRSTADVVGGHDAILRDNATYGRGLVGKSFVLDGDGDFVEVPDHPALNAGTGDFTVDLWVNFLDPEGEQILVEKYVETFGPESVGWTFSKGDGNRVFITGTEGVQVSIPPNAWLHFAARRSGTEVSVFVNGVQVGFADLGGPIDFDSMSSLKFGHRGSPDDTPGSLDDRGFFLNGRIDEVELFVGTALSDDEIRGIYFAGAEGKCKADVDENG